MKLDKDKLSKIVVVLACSGNLLKDSKYGDECNKLAEELADYLLDENHHMRVDDALDILNEHDGRRFQATDDFISKMSMYDVRLITDRCLSRERTFQVKL